MKISEQDKRAIKQRAATVQGVLQVTRLDASLVGHMHRATMAQDAAHRAWREGYAAGLRAALIATEGRAGQRWTTCGADATPGEGGADTHDLWRERPCPPEFFHEAKLEVSLQACAHGDPRP